MSDQRPKRETMTIEETTYDKIKDQIVAKQKSPRDCSGLGRGIEMNHGGDIPCRWSS
jgi:hypothetical protein